MDPTIPSNNNNHNNHNNSSTNREGVSRSSSRVSDSQQSQSSIIIMNEDHQGMHTAAPAVDADTAAILVENPPFVVNGGGANNNLESITTSNSSNLLVQQPRRSASLSMTGAAADVAQHDIVAFNVELMSPQQQRPLIAYPTLSSSTSTPRQVQQQHHNQHQVLSPTASATLASSLASSNALASNAQRFQQHQQQQQQQQQRALAAVSLPWIDAGLASRAGAAMRFNFETMDPERAMAGDDADDSHYHSTSSSMMSGGGGGESNSTSGWSIVETTRGTPPSERSLHAAAVLNGNMYVFGGYSGEARVNTFHAYSFAEKRWSPVLPSATSGPAPSPRDRHVAVVFGNSFLVHGGFDGTTRVSDFHAFDFSSMTWREIIALQGRPPSPRHSHAAVVHNNSMFLFGGYDGSYKSDLHEFDFTLSKWTAILAAGRRPRARYRATCVVHRNMLILYGGHDGTRHLSDAHIFDLDTRTWSVLVTEGTPPIPRDSHSSVVHGNSMYVFGGSSGSALSDLHELQLPSNETAPAKWRAIKATTGEQPRHRFCHAAVVYNDAMYVFGGYDGSDRLNDFLRFDFAVYDLSFEIPPSSLVSDLRALINNETLSDVTFLVEGQPVYAHKLMLMRCSYFRALFLSDMRESRESTIRMEQVSHPIFLAILEYLYTDQLRITLDSAMEVFGAADLFCIPRLKTMCEKRMLQSITVDNAATIFHAADMHSALALRRKAKKFIVSNFERVSKSASFEEMGRSNMDLVFEILQSR